MDHVYVYHKASEKSKYISPYETLMSFDEQVSTGSLGGLREKFYELYELILWILNIEKLVMVVSLICLIRHTNKAYWVLSLMLCFMVKYVKRCKLLLVV